MKLICGPIIFVSGTHEPREGHRPSSAHQGWSQDVFKEGVDTSRGVQGHAPLGKDLISNPLKRYFLHFVGSLTTKYQHQNSDIYT